MEMEPSDKRRVSAKLASLAEWLDGGGYPFSPSEQGWQRLAIELDAISLFIRSRFDMTYPTFLDISSRRSHHVACREACDCAMDECRKP